MSQPVLVTGAAGFIGAHLCQLLAAQGRSVIALDALPHDPQRALRQARRERLLSAPGIHLVKRDLTHPGALDDLLSAHTAVVHLAGEPGVRQAGHRARAITQSNLVGFTEVLSACLQHKVPHLLFASSSSIYGHTSGPSPEDLPATAPLSFYAATKRANELMALSLAHSDQLPSTALRMFCVYGPWGRPDAAVSMFAAALEADRDIHLHHRGQHRRDLTYISDVVQTLAQLLDHPPTGPTPHRALNIGGGAPLTMTQLVSRLAEITGHSPRVHLEPARPDEATDTHSDPSRLRALLGPLPHTPLQEGLEATVRWVRAHGHRFIDEAQ